MFVKVLQHILNTNLFAVTDRPHAIELQTLDDGTLQDEHCRSARA